MSRACAAMETRPVLAIAVAFTAAVAVFVPSVRVSALHPRRWLTAAHTSSMATS